MKAHAHTKGQYDEGTLLGFLGLTGLLIHSFGLLGLLFGILCLLIHALDFLGFLMVGS